MNKIFRVIWNRTLNMWVVASELATGRTKASSVGEVIQEEKTANHNAKLKLLAQALLSAGVMSTFAVGVSSLILWPTELSAQYVNIERSDGGGIITGPSAPSGSVAISNTTLSGTAENAVAIGFKAKVETFTSNNNPRKYGNVAIGSHSVAYDAVATSSKTINGLTFDNFSGDAPVASFSIADNTTVSNASNLFVRHLQGVAAGRIESGSTDGINGSQLFRVIEKMPRYISINSSVSGADSNQGNNGAKATNSIALGPNASINNTAEGSIAIGLGTKIGVGGKNNIVLGTRSKVYGTGEKFTYNGQNGDVIIDPESVILIGHGAKVFGIDASNAIALGTNAFSGGKSTIAIGQNSDVSSENGIAIGTNSKSANHAIALGPSAIVEHAHSVALGSHSRAVEGTARLSATFDSWKLTWSGGTTITNNATVNVGSRQIQSVAAGDVSANSTDAINGSQLWALANTKMTFAGNTGNAQRRIGDTINIKGATNSIFKFTGNGTDTLTLDVDNTKIGDLTVDNTYFEITNGTGRLLGGTEANIKFTDAFKQKLANLDKTYSVVADNAQNNNPITITPNTSGNTTTFKVKVDETKLKKISSESVHVTAGKNVTVDTTAVDATGKKTYTVNVSDSVIATKASGANLAYKANGNGNLTTKLSDGLNFVDGTHTKATVGANGSVTFDLSDTTKTAITRATSGGITFEDNTRASQKVTLENKVKFIGNSDIAATVSSSGNDAHVTFSINKNNPITDNGPNNGLVTGDNVKTYVDKVKADINASVSSQANLKFDGNSKTGTPKVNLGNDTLSIKGEANSFVTTDANDKTLTIKIDDTKFKSAVATAAASSAMLKYKGGANTTDKEVTLGTGLNFQAQDNIEVTIGDSGLVTHKLAKELKGITSIAQADDGSGAKLTFNADKLSVNNKKLDGLANANLSSDSTEAVTGQQLKAVKDTADGNKTDITNLKGLVGDGNLKFKGDTGGDQTVALNNGTLSITGDGQLVKTTSSTTGLAIAIDEAKLKEKVQGAVNVVSANNLITVSDNTANGVKTFTLTANANILAEGVDLTYKANGTGDKTVKLNQGLDFRNGTNTTAQIDDNGVVKFNVTPELTNITSIAGSGTIVTFGNGGLTLNSKKITGLAPAAAGTKYQEGTNGTNGENGKDAIAKGIGGVNINNVAWAEKGDQAVNKDQLDKTVNSSGFFMKNNGNNVINPADNVSEKVTNNDVVDFVDGANTVVSVDTIRDPQTGVDTNKISVHVTDLPMKHTVSMDGKDVIVTKVDGKYYAVAADARPDKSKEISAEIIAGAKVNVANVTAKPNEIGAKARLGNVSAATDSIPADPSFKTVDYNGDIYDARDVVVTYKLKDPKAALVKVGEGDDAKYYRPEDLTFEYGKVTVKAGKENDNVKNVVVVDGHAYDKANAKPTGTKLLEDAEALVKVGDGADAKYYRQSDMVGGTPKTGAIAVNSKDNLDHKAFAGIADLNGANANDVITVDDAKRMGFVVGTRNLPNNTDTYVAKVQNGNKLDIVGGHNIEVVGKTKGNTREVTVSMVKDPKFDSLELGYRDPQTGERTNGPKLAGDRNGDLVLTKQARDDQGNPVLDQNNQPILTDVRISGVAPGLIKKGSTDAVNGGQIYNLAKGFGQQLRDTRQRLRGGIAGAYAMASLIQSSLPSETVVSIAGGSYQGQNAVALGFSATTDNGKFTIKASGTRSGTGELGGSISVRVIAGKFFI